MFPNIWDQTIVSHVYNQLTQMDAGWYSLHLNLRQMFDLKLLFVWDHFGKDLVCKTKMFSLTFFLSYQRRQMDAGWWTFFVITFLSFFLRRSILEHKKYFIQLACFVGTFFINFFELIILSSSELLFRINYPLVERVTFFEFGMAGDLAILCSALLRRHKM